MFGLNLQCHVASQRGEEIHLMGIYKIYALLRRRRAGAYLFVLIFLTFFSPYRAWAAPSFAEEYQLKAVFLYNFANFIHWPPSVFEGEQTPFSICLLGDDPFGLQLEAAIEDQQARGRNLIVRRLEHWSEVGSCHILFISDSQQRNFVEIYQFTCRYPILTVAEHEDFIELGGMIRFFNSNKRVRLEINPNAIDQTGLKADANLLNLSKITRPALAACSETSP
jgi:hypothetical protein